MYRTGNSGFGSTSVDNFDGGRVYVRVTVRGQSYTTGGNKGTTFDLTI